MNDFILIAVTDPVVGPEATHAAAATGLDVITCDDPRDIARHVPRARAVITDRTTASHVAACGRARDIFFVAADPGPIDFEAALRAHAAQAFLLPAESRDLLAALSTAGESLAPPSVSGRCVAVVGATGGAGTSTFAAGLARTLEATVLIDGDPRAGGLDLVLGAEETPGVRWPELHLGPGQLDAADLLAALPVTADGIRLVSGTRSGVNDPFELSDETLTAVLESLQSHRVVLDGGAGPAAFFGAGWHDHVDHIVIVVPAEVRAAAAAAQITARCAAHGIPVSVVLRHRGWSSLATSDVEKIIHADIVAELPHLRRLVRDIELGGLPLELPRPLRQACERVIEDLGWVEDPWDERGVA